MTEALQSRVDALRSKTAAKTEAQRAIVREKLEESGFSEEADQLREEFGATLSFLQVGDLVIGKPPERGYTDFILLDVRSDSRAKQIEPRANAPRSRGKR